MPTVIILSLLVAFAPPAVTQHPSSATSAAATFVELERFGRNLERGLLQTAAERERLERERERQREQAEREKERQREQAERERERQQRERERQRELADRERERAREQAERERERARQQAERDRRRDGCIQEIERLTRTLRIGAKGELHLSNVAGDIVVSRGGGSEVQVEIVKTACGRTKEDALEMLKLVEVNVVERAARAEVTTHYPPGDELRRTNRRNVNVSVAYNVTVPVGTRLRVNSISGSVNAKDVSGDVALKSVSGTIRFANGRGACTAESISGNVEVIDSSFDGSMSASSASGNIVLRRVKARRIGISSISGQVILEESDGPAVDAKTVSGNVQMHGMLMKNSRYELGSHSGNVNVSIGGGTGFEVQATSFSGSVRSDIPFSKQDREPSRNRFNRTLRGVVGDGSAVLILTTFSGSISIGRR